MKTFVSPRLASLLFTSISFVVASPAKSQPAAGPSSSVQVVLEGFSAMPALEQSQTNFEDMIGSLKKDLRPTEDQIKQLTSVAKKIYPARNLLQAIEPLYTKKMPPERLAGAQTWLGSDDGKKYSAALKATYEASAAARDEYFRKTGEALLKPNRRNALRTFIIAAKFKENYRVWKKGMALGVRRGLNGLQAEKDRKTAKIVESEAATDKFPIDQRVQEQFLTFAAFLFRDMKNEEVDRCSLFFNSADGESHTKAFLSALETTLKGAAATLEEQFTKGKT